METKMGVGAIVAVPRPHSEVCGSISCRLTVLRRVMSLNRDEFPKFVQRGCVV
jgi:hypothetical protein